MAYSIWVLGSWFIFALLVGAPWRSPCSDAELAPKTHLYLGIIYCVFSGLILGLFFVETKMAIFFKTLIIIGIVAFPILAARFHLTQFMKR